MRELFDRALMGRRLPERLRGGRRALVLGVLFAASGLACGEEVLVGRWVLRSSPADAGLEGDGGSPDNPQSENAERARQHERARDGNKPAPHDGDKKH